MRFPYAITSSKEDYLKTPSLEFALRAKNLSKQDIEKVRQYISSLKKSLRKINHNNDK